MDSNLVVFLEPSNALLCQNVVLQSPRSFPSWIGEEGILCNSQKSENTAAIHIYDIIVEFGVYVSDLNSVAKKGSFPTTGFCTERNKRKRQTWWWWW